MKKLAVVGIGNLLLSDDGVGIHAVKELETKWKEEPILFVDQGTAIFELIGLFTEYQEILILDALQAGNEPGTIYKVSIDQLGEYTGNKSSLHDVQVMDLYAKVKLMGHNPNITIIGIEPAVIEYDLSLSERLTPFFQNYLDYVESEIRKIL